MFNPIYWDAKSLDNNNSHRIVPFSSSLHIYRTGRLHFYSEHVQDRCQKFAFLKLSRSACHEFGFQNYFRLISWNVASLEMSRISRIWTCSLISTWINRFGSPFLLPSSNFPALRSRFPNTGFKKWFISNFHIIILVWKVSSNQLFGLRIPVFRSNALSKNTVQVFDNTALFASKPLKRLIFSSYVDMGSWGWVD